MSNDFGPNELNSDLAWTEDENGDNVLTNTVTGVELKRVPALHLPDGTLMRTGVLFRVESTKKLTFNKKFEIKEGDFLIAKRYVTGDILLHTDTNPPFCIHMGAKYKKDFVFVTNLSKLKSGDLELKLKRVLQIENYECAAEIRDELNKRKI